MQMDRGCTAQEDDEERAVESLRELQQRRDETGWSAAGIVDCLRQL